MQPDRAWRVEVNGWRAEDQHNLESLFTQANGHLGVRGYAEEGVTGAGSDPMQFVAGYFDRSPVTRNTMVNLPTFRRLRVELAGEVLDLGAGAVREYGRTLDLREAVSARSFLWTSPQGRTTRVAFRSFASYPRWHLHATGVEITPLDWSGTVRVEDVFDGEGLTLHQRHHALTGHGALADGHWCAIRTLTSKLRAALASRWIAPAGAVWEPAACEGLVARRAVSFFARKGQETRLERVLAVATDFDRDAGRASAKGRALRQLDAGCRAGWAGLLREQRAAWKALWARSEVRIEGDPERAFKLRFSIFQLLQAYRPGDPRLSIGAKFLSGEHYSGHYFWDTDNFLLPFYLFTWPEAAQNLVEYRVRNLPGARSKARAKKFKGAFYPWEACPLDGRENCPPWWKDKEAKEPIRIPCGDIELHVNAAVALAASHYLAVAGRPRPPRLAIQRMLVEIARFWASRGVWEAGRYHIKDVIGPDEYHEYVDDNAYTNHTARWTLRAALALAGDPARARKLRITAREAAAWRKIVEGLELGHDAARGILAQDRTFLTLPELDRSALNPAKPLFRQMSMEEIGHLQAVKQADVLALFHQLPFDYDLALMQRCWDYYEPRTLHDSNLSAGSHAVVAALLGRTDDFLLYYDKVLNLDIGGASYNVVDGLHAANAGNAWSGAVIGAGGIRWDADTLFCTPRLPAGWTSLRFPLVYRGRSLRFDITPRAIRVACGPGRALKLVAGGRRFAVPAKACTLRLPAAPVGVVFDLDGVLVDSAVCHYRAWKKIADELGVQFDEKKNDLLRGVSRRESMMILLEGQLELSEEKLEHYMTKKNELYKQLVNEAGEELLLPGVKPFLTRLKLAGGKLAVASSSRNTPALLKQAGLDQHYFDAVADGNDIRNSKPDPEVFLLAAQRMGVPPSRCLCVEDAPAGIEAGRRAGMKTLGIGPADLGRCTWRRETIAATPVDELFDMLAKL